MVSRPELFFGNAITSRMESAPANSVHSLSKPSAMPPVRRCAVFESFQQEAKLLLYLFFRQTQVFKYPFLSWAIMNAYGATTDFRAVYNQVISIRPDFTRIRVEYRKILAFWRGEGMVHRRGNDRSLRSIPAGESQPPKGLKKYSYL